MIEILKQEFLKIFIPLCIFLILYVIDLILGILKGKFFEGISSEKLRKCVPKFCGYFGMIFMCYLLDILVLTSMDISYSPISLVTIIFFCLIEIKSIIENAKTLGVKTPVFVTKIVDKISANLEEETIEDENI